MRIVVAPQGFKGTLSGPEAAQAIADGVKRALPGAETVLCPVADGGNGTLDTLIAATGGELRMARVMGPMGQAAEAQWGVLGDGVTAVVEMAQASGLTLVPEGERDPAIATTYGTGQLIRTALDEGFKRIIVGVGGSATIDGGAGAAQALGVLLTDPAEYTLPLGAQGLSTLAHIELAAVHPWSRDAVIQVATDVSNPLCGPTGAAMTYGPQKGAKPAQLPLLDAALSNLATVIERELGVQVRDLPGAGAAGGLAAGLVAFLGAELVWGAELVCDAVGLDDKLAGASLAITGEGQVDGQTAYRKAPIEVAKRATAAGIPCLMAGGSLGPGAEEVLGYGVALLEGAAGPGAPLPATTGEAMSALAGAAERLTTRAVDAGIVARGT